MARTAGQAARLGAFAGCIRWAALATLAWGTFSQRGAVSEVRPGAAYRRSWGIELLHDDGDGGCHRFHDADSEILRYYQKMRRTHQENPRSQGASPEQVDCLREPDEKCFQSSEAAVSAGSGKDGQGGASAACPRAGSGHSAPRIRTCCCRWAAGTDHVGRKGARRCLEHYDGHACGGGPGYTVHEGRHGSSPIFAAASSSCCSFCASLSFCSGCWECAPAGTIGLGGASAYGANLFLHRLSCGACSLCSFEGCSSSGGLFSSSSPRTWRASWRQGDRNQGACYAHLPFTSGTASSQQTSSSYFGGSSATRHQVCYYEKSACRNPESSTGQAGNQTGGPKSLWGQFGLSGPTSSSTGACHYCRCRDPGRRSACAGRPKRDKTLRACRRRFRRDGAATDGREHFFGVSSRGFSLAPPFSERYELPVYSLAGPDIVRTSQQLLLLSSPVLLPFGLSEAECSAGYENVRNSSPLAAVQIVSRRQAFELVLSFPPLPSGLARSCLKMGTFADWPFWLILSGVYCLFPMGGLSGHWVCGSDCSPLSRPFDLAIPCCFSAIVATACQLLWLGAAAFPCLPFSLSPPSWADPSLGSLRQSASCLPATPFGTLPLRGSFGLGPPYPSQGQRDASVAQGRPLARVVGVPLPGYDTALLPLASTHRRVSLIFFCKYRGAKQWYRWLGDHGSVFARSRHNCETSSQSALDLLRSILHRIGAWIVPFCRSLFLGLLLILLKLLLYPLGLSRSAWGRFASFPLRGAPADVAGTLGKSTRPCGCLVWTPWKDRKGRTGLRRHSTSSKEANRRSTLGWLCLLVLRALVLPEPAFAPSALVCSAWLFVPAASMARPETAQDNPPGRARLLPAIPAPLYGTYDIRVPPQVHRQSQAGANVFYEGPFAWQPAQSTTEHRHLGVYVYTPHYRPRALVADVAPDDMLVDVLDTLNCHAPGDDLQVCDVVVPLAPQRFSGYLSVLRMPGIARGLQGGLAGVVLDLGCVGGHYFATFLPKQMSYEELSAYILPLAREDTTEMFFFIGTRTRPWPSCAMIELRDGDVIFVSPFSRPPTFPQHCRGSLSPRARVWSTLSFL